MEEKKITEQESISIIQEMIERSKHQLKDRSIYFLMWGFAVLGCALLQYILLKALQPHTQMVWLLMPVVAVIHVLIARKETRQEKVITYNNKAIRALWLALGISFMILAVISFKTNFNMFPFLILLYGIGTFTTGSILQFRPLTYGGIACFILCIVINYIEGPEQLLILALSILVSYIIPAFLLRREFKRQQA